MKVLGLVLLVSAFLLLLASVPTSDAAQTYSLRALTSSALTTDTIDFQFGTTNNPVGKYFQLQWSEAGKNSWKNFGGTKQVPSTRRFSITPNSQGITAGTYDFRAKVGSTSSSLNDETSVAKIVLSGASSSSSSGSTAGGSTGSTTSGTSSDTASAKATDYPPSVSISHSPPNPSIDTIVRFTAKVSDDNGLYVPSTPNYQNTVCCETTVRIFVDGAFYFGCTPSTSVKNYECSAAGIYGGQPFGAGTHTYYAVAIDNKGQITTTTKSSFYVPDQTTKTTTAASTTSTCQFTCSAYGYTEGQCYQGWQCTNGCVNYNQCSQSASLGSTGATSGASTPGVGKFFCIPSSIDKTTGKLTCDTWKDASNELSNMDGKHITVSDAAPSTIVRVELKQGTKNIYIVGTGTAGVTIIGIRYDSDRDGTFETAGQLLKQTSETLDVVFSDVKTDMPFILYATGNPAYIDYLGTTQLSSSASTTTKACQYACSAYKYSEGQCVQGWQCLNGCINYNSCTQSGSGSSTTTTSSDTTNSRTVAAYRFYQDTKVFGTITNPQYDTSLTITLLGKSFTIVGVGTSSIKLLAGTVGTATQDAFAGDIRGAGGLISNGVTSGTYTVIVTAAADNDWSTLQIRDGTGAFVDTLTNAREGDTKTSTKTGLDVKVTDIRVTGTDPATQHIEVDMVAGPTGDIEREYDGTADVSANSKERFPGKQDLYITFTGGSGQSSAAPGTIKAGSSINVERHTSASSAGTASNSQKQSATTCQFTCSAYKYSEGQCVQGWQCLNGCISYNSCTVGGSSCQFSCSSYGYSEGQCVQGWKCANGCIKYNSCVQ